MVTNIQGLEINDSFSFVEVTAERDHITVIGNLTWNFSELGGKIRPLSIFLASMGPKLNQIRLLSRLGICRHHILNSIQKRAIRLINNPFLTSKLQ